MVLSEDMSLERYEKIHSYGAEVVKTPGCESNVKEIYDKVHELLRDPANRVVQQFADFGNYRFHHRVTGHAVLDLVQDLARRGISDKHVTWIHDVFNMDLLLCIDDLQCLKGLQLLQQGRDVLAAELGRDAELLASWDGTFGISGVCNVLGAIQAARALRLGRGKVVVTVATDGFDRYPSVLAKLDSDVGPMTRAEARCRIGLFRDSRPEMRLEGTPAVRQRWHNQKYFTWVEQQGKTIQELGAQKSPEYWRREQRKSADIDRSILAARAS